MVNESSYWKADLAREVENINRRLRRYKSLKKRDLSPSEVLAYHIERFAFLVAFIARKLLDSSKLSQQLESESLNLTAYPARKRRYKRKDDEHEIMERYLFSRPTRHAISLRRLCDILIHSSEFNIVFNEERELSLAFNSERTQAVLYEITLSSLVTVANNVAEDDVVHSRWVWDKKLGKRIETVRSRHLPPDDELSYRRP